MAPGTGVMLHNRGGLFTLEDGHPNQIAPRKRPLHTIIPAFMEKGDVKIGFGIMGGFNQAQAHAQFVSDVADFGLDVQEGRAREVPGEIELAPDLGMAKLPPAVDELHPHGAGD